MCVCVREREAEGRKKGRRGMEKERGERETGKKGKRWQEEQRSKGGKERKKKEKRKKVAAPSSRLIISLGIETPPTG